jgi:hypothetical protein
MTGKLLEILEKFPTIHMIIPRNCFQDGNQKEERKTPESWGSPLPSGSTTTSIFFLIELFYEVGEPS